MPNSDPEKQRENQRQWYRKHKEEIAARNKALRAREKIDPEFRAERMAKRKEYKRRARRRQGKLTIAERSQKIKAQFGVAGMPNRAERLRQRRHAESVERRAKKVAERIQMKPWSDPALNSAGRFRIRYALDEQFREKQKARTAAAKRLVPEWYANQMLGGSSERRYPRALILTKQVQHRIRNYLKDRDEEHTGLEREPD